MAVLPQQQWNFFEILPLEHPFAFRSECYYVSRQIQFYPSNQNPGISFTATRKSKILGYIPIIGTIIGISRILKGVHEYRLFKNTHLHALSRRSAKWILRGSLECVPIIGGIISAITDLTVTILHKNKPQRLRLEDETPCGHCHHCGFCRC